MNPRTKYANLTDKELVQLHRWDVQGDELMEELWQRLEETIRQAEEDEE